ncbi:MAG TPA: metallophosphoesterase [Longimicrobium sp.]|nr:metallophosphoesterase [Longimicrobium sp.]
MQQHRTAIISLGLLLAAALAACGGEAPRVTREELPHTSIVTAGDIASCWWRSDEGTARLLDRVGGVVMPLGDLVYSSGTVRQFADCYDPTWGRHKERTRPVAGNHDYRTADGAPYYAYFGKAAGEPGKGWYSFDVDGWHVVVLNTETDFSEGSEQMRWLRRDLERHPVKCTLAATHRPRFSSGKHGDSERMKPLFQVLYDGGVDVLLSGHDHLYARYAPQDPRGRKDRERGIRQFVVGTGGAPFYDLAEAGPNSETRQNRVHGVLRLVFHPQGYDWEFVGINGGYSDRGSDRCH